MGITDGMYQLGHAAHLLNRGSDELNLILERIDAVLGQLGIGMEHMLPRPLHEIVEVDVVVPGCPPSADIIWQVLTELAAGRIPDLESQLRFGSPAIGASP